MNSINHFLNIRSFNISCNRTIQHFKEMFCSFSCQLFKAFNKMGLIIKRTFYKKNEQVFYVFLICEVDQSISKPVNYFIIRGSLFQMCSKTFKQILLPCQTFICSFLNVIPRIIFKKINRFLQKGIVKWNQFRQSIILEFSPA